MNAFLAAATDKPTLFTSVKIALVVGTVLGLINSRWAWSGTSQGDRP
jgi:hypothetical protein